MTWQCPACRTPIQYKGHDDQPRPGVIYRCSVCRLELSLNSRTGRLDVAPLPDDRPDKDRATI